MTVEQSLAARKISEMIRVGHSKQVAIIEAAKLVKSQGFGEDHAEKTAKEMAELVS